MSFPPHKFVRPHVGITGCREWRVRFGGILERHNTRKKNAIEFRQAILELKYADGLIDRRDYSLMRPFRPQR